MQNRSKGIGGHTRAHHGRSDSWITPPEIIEALGPFDLDPCAADPQPWPCAAKSYTEKDNGLSMPWDGRTFLNPPYGPETEKWLAKLAVHHDGIALTFARTETRWFHKTIFERADALLFLKGRLTFFDVNGKKGSSNAGGPSVLVAYGTANVKKLCSCGLDGHFVTLFR